MLIYIIIFIISLFFTYIAEKFYDKKSKKLFYFFSMLSIIIPSILAAFRDLSIGTDTSGYVLLDFKYAHIATSFSMLRTIMEQEYLFLFINYIVSLFTDNIHIILFLFQLIINFFIFKACLYNKKRCPLWLSYMCFLFLFFNKSLNMVRQSIALSIIMFGTKFIEEKKPFKYLFCVIVATLFHSTAIISIFCYIINIIINKKDKILYKFLIIVCSIFLIYSFSQIVNILITIGIVPYKYFFYTQSNRVDIEFYMIIFKLGLIFMSFYYEKSLKEKDKFNNYLLYSLILDFILFQSGSIYNNTQRFAYYFGYNQIFVLPQIYSVQKKDFNKKIILLSIIILLLTFFIVYYGVMGNDQTVPYVLGGSVKL